MPRATFIVPPQVIIPHTAERQFIGPGTVRLASGDILMVAPWGRPPVDFRGVEPQFPLPMLYRSRDGGRTWHEAGRLHMAWNLSGLISDGGITLLPLHDGRLALLAHRHVYGQHGGGLPIIAFSRDDGQSWTPARPVDGAAEGVWYVMNDRLSQLRGGRLVVPVSHMAPGMGTYEGDVNVGLCFFSDDGGATWRASATPARVPNDPRGMAEPCVVERRDGRLLMLARTGSGSLHKAYSADGGDTWTEGQPTTLMAPCAPLTLKRLPDGRLFVLYNHAAPLRPGAFFPRNPLAYAVSADDGETWGAPVIVDDEGQHGEPHYQHIYPSACFLPAGILIVYSTHHANADGSFGYRTPEQAVAGGGKCCVIHYPH